MVLKLYNTLTRKKEVFKPLHGKKVNMYSCGPTVYWYQHIGNMRGYFCWDILKRTLIFEGYSVKNVINITDVGHLTSDADEGEDKMEKAAKKEGKSAKEISEHYAGVFMHDLKELNILPPSIWAKATDHISDQIKLIKKLEEKGYTYKTSDGIYFDTSKVKDYGKLGRTNAKELQAGKRISMKEKKHATDFALWKFSPSADSKEKRQQEWESPWGIGFPGWHIECSAMSSKYLGEQFDIHTGGQEHIQVHHTDEIAQSESAFGKKPWVKYWLHNAWLLFNGGKMSKSSGSTYTLSDIEKKGFSPMHLRYLFLTTHYRKPLNFTFDKLEAAKRSYERLKNIVSSLEDDGKENKEYLKEFEKKMDDDLNYPEALQVLWKLLRDEKAKREYNAVKKMDEVLGLELFKEEKTEVPSEVKKLVDEREKARGEKNWKRADEIRDKIKSRGFVLEDTKEGVVVRKG